MGRSFQDLTLDVDVNVGHSCQDLATCTFHTFDYEKFYKGDDKDSYCSNTIKSLYNAHAYNVTQPIVVLVFLCSSDAMVGSYM